MNVDTAPWRFQAGDQKLVGVEYLAEIRELIRAVERPDFDEMLAYFADYSGYLDSRSRDGAARAILLEGAADKRIFDISTTHPQLQKALAMAQLAVCCHLLHGSKITRQQLSRSVLEAMAEQFVSSLYGKSEEYLKRITGKFHVMDAIRTMQLLRILGLVARPVSAFHQLGIGTAEGTRDVLALHLMPSIQRLDGGNGPQLELSTEKQSLTDIIIADANPMYREVFEELNSDTSNNITAYNKDTLTVLHELEQVMKIPRNLVTGLRVEHRMIPDVTSFLGRLGNCVSSDCDFILSIGAGDTRGDFKGRIKLVKGLFKALDGAGFRPVLFKFHEDGNLEHQWNTLRYGNRRASTYQLLYCRVNGSVLAGQFS